MKRVYFGIGQGLDRHAKPLRNVATLRLEAYKHIANTFGGFHASIGEGGWMSPVNGLMLEESLGITVFTDRLTSVFDVANYLRDLFLQESILVAIEPVESLQFVSELPIAV